MYILIPEKYLIIPSRKAFLIRAGYYDDRLADTASMKKLIDGVCEAGLVSVRPSVEYSMLPIKDIDLELLPKHFCKKERIVLFVSTLGITIDNKISRLLKDGKDLEAMLLDAWGSESIETLNRYFHNYILRRYQIPSHVKRFSPGYEGLDIRANSRLIDIVASRQVKADPKTGILIPRKSTVCLLGCDR